MLLTLGPVFGVTIGVISNTLTNHWSWWLFAILTILVCLAAIVAVALDEVVGRTIRRGAHFAIRSPQKTPRFNTLPNDADHFTGRQEEISRLSAMIGGTVKSGAGKIAVYSVEGIGGVGKTSLVIHVAHQIATRYRDAVLYIDLRAHDDGQKPLTADEALAILLSDLNIPGDLVPDSLEGRRSIVATRIGQRPRTGDLGQRHGS